MSEDISAERVGRAAITGGLSEISTVTDAIGLTDVAGAKEARAASQKAAGDAADVARESLAFQKEQFAIWTDVYGEIQKNLSDYYSSLGTDRVITLGLQNQAREAQTAQRNIETIFAQRGISDSGLELSTLANLEVESATQRAGIRSSAEDIVRGQQTDFLRIGLGQQPSLLGGVQSAFGLLTGTFQQQSGLEAQRALAIGQSNRQFAREVVSTGAGIAAGLGQPSRAGTVR